MDFKLSQMTLRSTTKFHLHMYWNRRAGFGSTIRP